MAAGSQSLGLVCVAFVALLGIVVARHATAQVEPNCTSPMAQVEMNICAGRAFDAADRRLNDLYKRVRGAMRERDGELPAELRGAEAALVAGQRGWIAYRDGHCAVVGSEAAGGSMRPMLESGCMEELTQARTKELASLLGEQ